MKVRAAQTRRYDDREIRRIKVEVACEKYFTKINVSMI